MYESLKLKEIKARISHHCVWCGGYIPRGTYAIYRVYMFNRDFMADYMHNNCYQASKDLDWSGYPDGFEFGSFKRGTTRNIND